MGIMWNYGCEHCAHAPIRLIENGINKKPWGGMLVVDDEVDHENCHGVCGVGITPEHYLPGGDSC